VGSGWSQVSPRSTVGTLTEIQDFLRLLFSKAGEIFCYRCGRELQRFTPHQIIDEVLKFPKEVPLMILAPIPESASLSWLKKEGFVRVRTKNQLLSLDQMDKLELSHTQVVIDRLTLDSKDRVRLVDSTELALRFGQGVVYFSLPETEDVIFCTDYRCVDCEINYGELTPGFFSFNNPYGACSKCHGVGWLSDESKICSKCHGTRFKKNILSVRLASLNIHEVGNLNVPNLLAFLKNLKFKDLKRREISKEIIRKIIHRLNFLSEFGLSYLDMNRRANTLSSGEFQRVRLATQVATGLVGVLYILDEPTTGLHAREIHQLIKMLRMIRDQGNSLIVIEHDSAIIRACDRIVELGPGAGPKGGRIVAEGTVEHMLSQSNSATASLLNGKLSLSSPKRMKPRSFLSIRGASIHNLKQLDINIPLGVFCCVTGVSGSGKSSLVEDVLCKAFRKEILSSDNTFNKILGLEKVDRLILVDARSIGRNVRSNVATLIEVFDTIRKLFSSVPESRLRGYTDSRFSFNLKGGRCEACEGEGIQEIQMYFLADLEISCEICQGSRYNPETLEVKYKGKNIAEVLEMTVEEASQFFKNLPMLISRLRTLVDIGLGYLKLGQSSKSLSGGEAQRIKLAGQLSKRARGHALYILDEPTRGLHLADIEKLLRILFQLRDQGNSILVVEHHLDVIRCSDYVIDLGPGAGDEGGMLVAEGTPEEIILAEKSYTGKFLRDIIFSPS
jgi:excinuclease ABC subunit A